MAALVALAVWTAASIAWSPLPSLAHEETLLTIVYAAVLAVPLLTVSSDRERGLILGAVAVGFGAVAVATGVELRVDPNADMFNFGRLIFPVTYVNAGAAFFLLAVWPAVGLAAQRTAPVLLRALGSAAAAALLAAWLVTQSKGGAAALVVSAIVLFAVSPARLRLLVPTIAAAAVAAAAYWPLTAPFRAEDAPVPDAAREAGAAILVVTAVAFAIGLVYALVDRRVTVGARVRTVAAYAALAAVVIAVAAPVVGFFFTVEDPRTFAANRWDEFKGVPTGGPGSSHFATLESQRYDFWRVAVNEIADHPVAGIGARGYYVAYLQHGRSRETPARTHSLPLDALAELGIVGLALLTATLALPLAAAARRARRSVPVAVALAAAVYWLAHASIDWLWTLPVVGIPFFVLLGVAASGDERWSPGTPARIGGAAAVVGLALVTLAPAWLAGRYLLRAVQEEPAAARADLRRAERLNPFAVSPLLLQARLARSRAERIRYLERAVEKQPKSAGIQLLLGRAYLDAGRRTDGVDRLRRAHELAPRDEAIERALRDAD